MSLSRSADSRADEVDVDVMHRLTPAEQQLPAHLVERILHVLRLAGVPLALETGGTGVYLERDDPIAGPTDRVVVTWLVTDVLLDATDSVLTSDRATRKAADRLASAAVDGLEDALRAILSAGGLIVANNPATNSLTVWARTGMPVRFGPADD
jgi:hypothetical protein